MRFFYRQFLFIGLWLCLGSVLVFVPKTAATDWLPLPDKVAVMVVCSHPDDEGIFFGGVLPYYCGVLQVPTMLISMTSGGGDQNGYPLRENELRNACAAYGMRYEPIFAHFKDIPSHNPDLVFNPYTNTIDLTWDWWADWGPQGDGRDVEAGKLRGANFLAEQIRRYKPDIIITHDLNGEYGHDNHKATARSVTNAFFIAANPAASAANLTNLPPWQAKKLYLHLYPTNQLFHRFWEIPVSYLNNRSARQIVDSGLAYHVSQTPPLRVTSSVYRFGELYDAYPCEWWGLYASTVGLDTVLTQSTNIYGFTITNGVAVGNFLEHASVATPGITNNPPVFRSMQLLEKPALRNKVYLGQTLLNHVDDPSSLWGGPATFIKISGPAWLNIEPDGSLIGTPSSEDIGLNTFVIRVANAVGSYDETTLQIEVTVHGMISWWKADETGGAVAVDSVPPQYNGQIFGGVTLGQPSAIPYSGYSMQFDGVSGKLDIPYVPDLNLPVFTTALWAKVTGGMGTYRSPLTNRRSNPSAGYIFYAGVNNRWQFWTGDGNHWNALDGGNVVLDQWIHLAAVSDGTTISFYTNGTLAASTAVAFRPNDSAPFRIGAGASEGNGQYWFPGYVDDVRIYRKPFTATDVAALYSNRPPTFMTSPMDLPDGTVGVNYTGYSLIDRTADPDVGNVLSFSKIVGPAWLVVSPNGTLSGRPTTNDLGLNTIVVSVKDSFRAADYATLQIVVHATNLVPTLAQTTLSNGVLALRGAGLTGRSYVLEATTNLAAPIWINLATNQADATATFEFIDPEAANFRQRFYRVRTRE